jgi:hypothetical protein
MTSKQICKVTVSDGCRSYNLLGVKIEPIDSEVFCKINLPDGTHKNISINKTTEITQSDIEPYPSFKLTVNNDIIMTKKHVFKDVIVEVTGSCTISTISESFYDG